MPIALTPRASLRILLILALFGVFLAGCIANIFPPIAVHAEHERRWVYPDHFHYVTGMLEFACAIFLVREKTRRIGAILGGIVMAGGAITFLWNGEFGQIVAPLAVLAGLALSLYLDEKAQEARWEGKTF